jgi:aspartyl-tRNA(Asn)/glutamyl-tRNA(Gln) amidotransferase subunit C
MKIPIEEARRIAALAKLELDEPELERYAGQLGTILEHMDKLRQVDTEGVELTPGPALSEPTLRADTPHPSLELRQALDNAPEAEHSLFRVPRVIG